jgi:hypothetical protein
LPPLINWIPIADIGMPPDVLEFFLIGQKLETGQLAETWLGTNAFDSSQKFVLQLRPSKPGSPTRSAILVSESLGEDEERIPRGFSPDQVAEAAGFLGFEWFNYLSLEVGRVLFCEEPPPIPGVQVFQGRIR